MSILTSIKKVLNIHEAIDNFDQDLILYINAVFMDLNQLGLGPKHPFEIEGVSETWLDFYPDIKNFGSVKTYIFLKVKLLFDAPTNAFLVNSIESQIKEIEWRLIAQKELKTQEGGTNG